MVVVDGAAVRVLHACTFKSGAAYAARTAINTVDGRIKRHWTREAVSHRKAVVFRLIVVDLDIELVSIAIERQIAEQVLCDQPRRAQIRLRENTEDFGGNGIDPARRNDVAGERRPARPAVWVTGRRIVNRRW